MLGVPVCRSVVVAPVCGGGPFGDASPYAF